MTLWNTNSIVSPRSHILVSAGSAVAAGLAVLAIAAVVANGWTLVDAVDSYVLSNLSTGAGLAVCGSVLTWKRPRNPIGWTLLLGGLSYLSSAAGLALSEFSQTSGWPEQVTQFLATFGYCAWPFAIGVWIPLSLLLFPEGMLPSVASRILACSIVVTGAAFVAMVAAEPISDPHWFTIAAYRDYQPLWDVAGLAGVAVYLALAAMLVIRFVRGDARTRGQILWVVLALIVTIVLAIPATLLQVGENVPLLLYTLIPVGILIAILRHNLFDISLVISRTVAWFALTVVISGAFVGVVAVLGTFLGDAVGSVIAALLVALAFDPLRRWLQRAASRLLFGRRSDPVFVMRMVAHDVGSATDLDSLLARLAVAWRVPRLALVVSRPDGVIAPLGVWGEATTRTEVFGLRHEGVIVGSLEVGLRRGDHHLSRVDRALIDLIGPILALLVQSAHLTRELVESRGRIVEATEGERLRIQRDLHDGVASALTGILFTLEGARNLAVSDVAAIDEVIAGLQRNVITALASLRVVMMDLRPPELDTMGLLISLRQAAAESRTTADGRAANVEIRSAGPLGRISPGVETAAYRICIEAMTNALRHSAGTHVVVEVAAAAGELRLRVNDDGSSSAPWQPGIGLTSMRERADVLGGSFAARAGPHGGEVLVTLPLQPNGDL